MLDPGAFLQALALAGVAAGASTFVGVKMHSQRLDLVEKDVERLATTIEGPRGLQVKVARLESRNHV